MTLREEVAAAIEGYGSNIYWLLEGMPESADDPFKAAADAAISIVLERAALVAKTKTGGSEAIAQAIRALAEQGEG